MTHEYYPYIVHDNTQLKC